MPRGTNVAIAAPAMKAAAKARVKAVPASATTTTTATTTTSRKRKREDVEVLLPSIKNLPSKASVSKSSLEAGGGSKAAVTEILELYMATKQDFHKWLNTNHSLHKGAWIYSYKASSSTQEAQEEGDAKFDLTKGGTFSTTTSSTTTSTQKASTKAASKTIDFGEAYDVAICFGWTASLQQKVNEMVNRLYFSPRNPKSGWSVGSKTRVEAVIQQGLMMPPGKALIDTCKANGSWTMFDAARDIHTLPEDLEKEFSKVKKAREGWEKLSPSTRRGILVWLISAKRPETRRKRIQDTVVKAAVGQASH